jgi:hypothetical protein
MASRPSNITLPHLKDWLQQAQVSSGNPLVSSSGRNQEFAHDTCGLETQTWMVPCGPGSNVGQKLLSNTAQNRANQKDLEQELRPYEGSSLPKSRAPKKRRRSTGLTHECCGKVFSRKEHLERHKRARMHRFAQLT